MGDSFELKQITMKFALALLAFTAVEAVEVESVGYGSLTGAYTGAYNTVSRVIASRPATYYLNGHGHHSYSYTSHSSDSSYSSDDYSSSDYGYGYRAYHGRNRYYRYRPRYSSGRYYYGSRYANRRGVPQRLQVLWLQILQKLLRIRSQSLVNTHGHMRLELILQPIS